MSILSLKGVIQYESESNLATDEICEDYCTICEGKRFVYERVNGFFYHSKEYELIRDGISDLHCMSDGYLVEDLMEEMSYNEP